MTIADIAQPIFDTLAYLGGQGEAFGHHVIGQVLDFLGQQEAWRHANFANAAHFFGAHV